MRWQSTAIARLQFIQPRPPVAAQRLVTGYALRKKQPFDAIDVANPFNDQHFAFAAEAAAVLFLGGWRLDHCADTRLTAFVRQQRPNQGLSVKLVG
jgi:hypothetical protein